MLQLGPHFSHFLVDDLVHILDGVPGDLQLSMVFVPFLS